MNNPNSMIKVFYLLDYPKITQLLLGCWSMYSLLRKNNKTLRKSLWGTEKLWRKKNISIYFESILAIPTNFPQRHMKNVNNSRNPTIDRNVLQISKSISLGAISLAPLIFPSFIKISCYTIFSYPIISSLSSVSATRFTNSKTLQSSSHVLKRLSISNSSSSKVKLHLYPHVDLKLINFIILYE